MEQLGLNPSVADGSFTYYASVLAPENLIFIFATKTENISKQTAFPLWPHWAVWIPGFSS